MSTTVQRAVVVATNPASNNNQAVTQIALYNPDGTKAGTVNKQAAQADTVAADLAALKVDFNALLAKLRLANIIA